MGLCMMPLLHVPLLHVRLPPFRQAAACSCMTRQQAWALIALHFEYFCGLCASLSVNINSTWIVVWAYNVAAA